MINEHIQLYNTIQYILEDYETGEKDIYYDIPTYNANEKRLYINIILE